MLTTIKARLKKTPESFYTIATIIAAAQINYAIVHSGIVYIVLLVMLTHELAHYFMGKLYKANAKLPFFIPLPFFVIGVTKISKLKGLAKKNVSISGPIVGFITALLLIIYNYVNLYTSFIPLIALAIGEIVTNYIGSDGSKYRQAKKEMKVCTSS